MPDPFSGYEISTDSSRLDIPFIHGFLLTSYWAKDIPLEVVKRSIENSLCFGAYLLEANKQQVAFARVITDYATFGYLCDVFVAPEYQGRGIGKAITAAVVNHPPLQTLRRFLLVTRDAHSLYASHGFQAITKPENFMAIHKPAIYQPS
jgi:N-acetylglutamate synthase-like GNAT family acetyltransferase